MYCRNCSEENPENAVFCRNCGNRLIEDVKKAEVIETENNNAKSTASTNGNDSPDWIGCCLCLIAIFIIFAILGAIL
ncbi:zinc-ribbon domain-containing protein [Methanobrevibacter sp.]